MCARHRRRAAAAAAERQGAAANAARQESWERTRRRRASSLGAGANRQRQRPVRAPKRRRRCLPVLRPPGPLSSVETRPLWGLRVFGREAPQGRLWAPHWLGPSAVRLALTGRTRPTLLPDCPPCKPTRRDLCCFSVGIRLWSSTGTRDLRQAIWWVSKGRRCRSELMKQPDNRCCIVCGTHLKMIVVLQRRSE